MWYFAYGSNLCRYRLLARVASARYGRIAKLIGYEFRFHKLGLDGSAKADAYATGSPDDAVWGTLVELDPAELPTLDRFEPGYDRRFLEVELPLDGGRHQANVYVAQADAVDPSLLPFSWYRQMVIDGGAARGLPDDYLAGIAAMPARSAPDSSLKREGC